MDFNKIKLICEEQRLSIPQLAEKIGISEAGLYQSLRNQSMKVDILEKIAQELNVPVWIFFDPNPQTQIEEITKEVQEFIVKIQILEASNSALIKEVKGLNDLYMTTKLLTSSQQRIIENNEVMISNLEDVIKKSKIMPTITETMKFIEDFMTGKIKIDPAQIEKFNSMSKELKEADGANKKKS
jgi:transcriptional regulator with XRE-family HTH domain